MKDSFRFTNEYLFCLFQLVGTMVFLKLSTLARSISFATSSFQDGLQSLNLLQDVFSKKCMHRFVEGFD